MRTELAECTDTLFWGYPIGNKRLLSKLLLIVVFTANVHQASLKLGPSLIVNGWAIFRQNLRIYFLRFTTSLTEPVAEISIVLLSQRRKICIFCIYCHFSVNKWLKRFSCFKRIHLLTNNLIDCISNGTFGSFSEAYLKAILPVCWKI